MLKNSQTKIIAPIITLGLVREFVKKGSVDFSDRDVRHVYTEAVSELKQFLGHDLHIGAKYYDAYGSRMSRYGVLDPTGHLRYKLQDDYQKAAVVLSKWIPNRIKELIEERLGIIPSMGLAQARSTLAQTSEAFLEVIRAQIVRTPGNFEIFCFAVLKVHLEKFACRIYRDTRTSAHDAGVDISTNFGVVYQIKKLRVYTEAAAKRLYSELKSNFDRERLQDGNVIIVIDDISKQVRDYLINLKVHSISRDELIGLAANFEDCEDRQKVLRIVFEEFRREYSGPALQVRSRWPPYVAKGKGAGLRLYSHYDVDCHELFATVRDFTGPVIITYHRSEVVQREARIAGIQCRTVNMHTAHTVSKRQLILHKPGENGAKHISANA